MDLHGQVQVKSVCEGMSVCGGGAMMWGAGRRADRDEIYMSSDDRGFILGGLSSR